MRQMSGIAVLALALAGLVFAVQTGRSALAPVGAGLALWLVGGAARDLWMRTGGTARRLPRLPRADRGRAVAHAGFGVAIMGIAALTAWDVEDIRVARAGDTFEVGRYQITLVGVDRVQGPNWVADRAELAVAVGGREVARMFPEKRFYPVAQMPTTEAAIRSRAFGDLYLVIGEPQDAGGWAVRTYIKPFAGWIWGGAILMALGGFLSLSDRRFRVAAGARAARPMAAE
jgi:cytochrome c-type biogenesis protein CcmF